MKLISLSCIEAGYACGTSSFINNHYYKNKKQRDFFDLITCSMKSVNQVLLNQTEYYFKEINKINIPNNTENRHMKFQFFDDMISYHDFNDEKEESYKKFQNLYKQLANQLIEDIKTQDKIYFFRYVRNDNDLCVNEIINFYNIVKNISNSKNNKLEFYFVILTDTKNYTLNEKLKHLKNIFFYNFLNYIDKNKIYNENIYFKITFDYDYINLKKMLKI
jgi:hypothetical protein